MEIPKHARIAFGVAMLFIGISSLVGENRKADPCISGPVDGRLAACTSLIEKGTLKGRDLAVAYLQRGLVHVGAQAWDTAAADFSYAIEADPTLAIAWSNRGYANAEMKRFDQALADLAKAEELDPKLGIVHQNRAFVYSLQGNREGAMREAVKAAELAPDDPKNFYNLGVLKGEQGDVDGARAAYEKAIEIDPRNADSLVNLGVLEVNRGAYDQAMANYRRAAEADPSNARVNHNIAFVHWLRHEWQPALEAANRQIEINPGIKETFLIRAMSRSKLGDLDGALSDHASALALDARYLEAYVNRAEVQIQKGLHQAAVQDSSRAIELLPPKAPAVSYLLALRGYAYAQLGEKEQARTDFERALTIDPNEQIAKDGLANLGA